MKHIAFILGTRPEILKLLPVIKEIPPEQREIIWTGQHYTPSLAEDWWEAEGFKPTVSIKYDVTSDDMAGGCEANRLVAMIPPLIQWLQNNRHYNWVVVQGDTTSAFAGAYAALKLRIPILHVESGGRSGQRDQAEEQNRRLIDTIATCRAAAYLHDLNNLMREGLSEGSFWSGDTLIDNLHKWEMSHALNPRNGNILTTIHRAETLHNPQIMEGMMRFLHDLHVQSGNVKVIAHPHLQKSLQLIADKDGIPLGDRCLFQLVDPLPPSAFRSELIGADLFITDSGGAATEAAYFGVPTLIARDSLELKDLEKCGRLVLGGRTQESLSAAMLKLQCNAPLSLEVKQAWHGQAGKMIAERLMA